MEFLKVGISEIIPYENNPRLNIYAIEPVMESIKQCGNISPIILDENHVILAGHTRYEALSRLGYKEVDCVIVPGLSEEQKKKYRILDNKTAEIAEWDETLLKGELENLDLDGIHWFDDLLNPNISEIAETSAKKEKEDKHEVMDDGIVRCPRCGSIVEGPDEYFEEESDVDEITWSPDEE